MSNKLSDTLTGIRAKRDELMAARARLEAERLAPDPLTALDEQLQAAQAAEQAEQNVQRAAAILALQKSELSLTMEFEKWFTAEGAARYAALADVHAQIAALGGMPHPASAWIAGAFKGVEIQCNQRAQAESDAERTASYPKYEILELEEKKAAILALQASRQRAQPAYNPSNAEHEQDMDAARGLEFMIGELKHPGEYARQRAKAQAKAAAAARGEPRTLAEAAARDAEEAAERMAEQGRTVFSVA